MHHGARSDIAELLFRYRRRRSTLRPAAALILLMSVALLPAVTAGCKYGGDMEMSAPNGEKTMNIDDRPSNRELRPGPGIPPIDKQVPENFQTATFALG